ncbi:hypothetical protein [Intrasporangium sp. DVR]|uniref:hypothetical protein n=1 Tax=Intrasporangium sp. DVR TaxID=3127867 RepID=UPI00313A63AE
MSAADLPRRGRPSFARLVEVEARKQVDTRSGRWLLGTAAALVLAVYGAGALLGGAGGFADAFAVGAMPLGVLLPVITILGVTTEWSTGSSVITFGLEPRRGRVLAAKVLGGLGIAAALIVLALVAAALTTWLAAVPRGRTPAWDLSWWQVTGLSLLLLLGSAQGAALGALIQHTAASVAGFLLVPTLGTVLFTAVLDNGPLVAWLSINDAMAPLTGPVPVTTTQLAQLGTAGALWIVVPGVLGAFRWARREIS